MKIDIDQLSEAELIDLNNCIIARLRFLEQMRAHVEMLELKSAIGSPSALQDRDRLRAC